VTPNDWQPGTLLGQPPRYQIEHMLSQDDNSLGQTYLAHDIAATGRPCIIKRLVVRAEWGADTQRQAMTSFDYEARMLMRLNVPGNAHIPAMYDYMPESYALVMQYIPGTSLDTLVQQQGDRLSLAEALHYVRAACAALVYMHSRMPEPVLHRALQPAHLRRDPTGRLWLVGFGLAKALPRQLPRQQAQTLPTTGTPGYTSPEQWQGSTEPRSDVYALGATFYTLLTGERPRLSLALQSAAELGLRPDIARLIRHTMALDVDERPTASLLLAELDRLLAAARDGRLNPDGTGQKVRVRGAG
jgi:serine/threonine protein kinase